MRIRIEPDLAGESFEPETFEKLREAAVLGWFHAPSGPGILHVVRDYRFGPPVMLRGLLASLDTQLVVATVQAAPQPVSGPAGEPDDEGR